MTARGSDRSIELPVRSVGTVDTACAARGVQFAEWADLTRSHWVHGFENWLLGQVELGRRGTSSVHPRGSFTRITGVPARKPARTSSVAAAINGVLDAWVRASAIELWGRWRINAVSPTVLTKFAQRYAALYPAHRPVRAADVTAACVHSIQGPESGRVVCP
jgi:hypothetical protein